MSAQTYDEALVATTFRLPPDLLDAVKLAARENQHTQAQELVCLIEDGFRYRAETNGIEQFG